MDGFGRKFPENSMGNAHEDKICSKHHGVQVDTMDVEKALTFLRWWKTSLLPWSKQDQILTVGMKRKQLLSMQQTVMDLSTLETL
jgi:hypothetical protein